MRKPEKEITSPEEISALVNKSVYAVLSMLDGNSPYAVPLNVSWDGEYFYAHCAHEGKKLDLLRQNPNVHLTFVPEAEYVRRSNKVACGSTMRYRSVLVSGAAEVLGPDADEAERLRGFKSIADHFGVGDLPLQAGTVARTTLIRIKSASVTAKRNPA